MSEPREYETICLFAPDATGETKKKVEEKIQKIFTSHKVKEVTRKEWGNRKLAYPIKRYKTAHYVQYIYQAPGHVIADLERNLSYEESVLRYLTVRHTKHIRKDVVLEPGGFEASDY